MNPPVKPASAKKSRSVKPPPGKNPRTKPIPATRNAPPSTALSKRQYEALSEFRYQLRRFLNFSERAAKAAGLTPLQYQLLLHVRGFPGRDWASVGELAERLQMQQHGVVALLTRCEQHGLIERRSNSADRRLVEIHLLPAGVRQLQRLATLHDAELRSLQNTFRVARITAFNDSDLAD